MQFSLCMRNTIRGAEIDVVKALRRRRGFAVSNDRLTRWQMVNRSSRLSAILVYKRRSHGMCHVQSKRHLTRRRTASPYFGSFWLTRHIRCAVVLVEPCTPHSTVHATVSSTWSMKLLCVSWKRRSYDAGRASRHRWAVHPELSGAHLSPTLPRTIFFFVSANRLYTSQMRITVNHVHHQQQRRLLGRKHELFLLWQTRGWIECINHTGHLIVFNMFLHFVTL